jgi:nitroreductase
MDTLTAIKKRRSIREFTGDPIPSPDLEEIVNAARLAATGSNKQPWNFVLVTNKDVIQRLSKAAEWSTNAAAIIAVVMDPVSKYWLEDGSAAIENMLLAATALGYGSCWVQGSIEPHRAEFKLLLNIPDHLKLLALIVVGVPVQWPEAKDKKPLEAVLHRETY